MKTVDEIHATLDSEFDSRDLDAICIQVRLAEVIDLALGFDPEEEAESESGGAGWQVLARLVEIGAIRRSEWAWDEVAHAPYRYP